MHKIFYNRKESWGGVDAVVKGTLQNLNQSDTRTQQQRELIFTSCFLTSIHVPQHVYAQYK